MSSLTNILTGSFTSDGTAVTLSLPSDVQDFEMINITDIGSTAAATPVMTARWATGMSSGSAIYATKTNGAATIAIPTTTTANGFTRITDSGAQSLGAPLAGTAITAASPAVISMASTSGLSQGDIVRVYGTTGMLQIAGMEFTLGSVVANTSAALAYLDASGFAAAATAATVRRVPYDARYYPRRRFITKITQASSAVITLSVTHGFTVGQEVRMIVPETFGMVEMDQLLGTVTAIDTTNNTITVDVDSSAFTAFAFPTSATAAGGITFAQVVPVGEAASGNYANLLDDATVNDSIRGITVGTAVQTSGKVYRWFARRGISM